MSAETTPLWKSWWPGKRAEGLPLSLGEARGAGLGVTSAQHGFDQALVWVVLSVMAWGLVMVYSASIALPDNPRFANYAQHHFVLRHAISITIGLIAGLIATIPH